MSPGQEGSGALVAAVPGGGYVFGGGALARLNRFDANGRPLGSVAGRVAEGPSFLYGTNTLAVAPDGKILATGFGLYSPVPGDSFTDVAVVRLRSDGSPDPAFNPGDGYSDTSGGGAESEALLPNGDILTAGTASVPNTINSGFALVRYTPGGRLDPAFGGGTGMALTTFPGKEVSAGAAAVAVLPNGHVLLAGTVTEYSNDGSSSSVFAAAEYFPDGRPDLSFGRGGLITTPLPGDATAAALAVLPNGRFVIAGTTVSGPHSHFILVRYYPNGTVDNTFGSGGVSITAEAPNATAHAMALLPGNKLLVAGSIGPDFGVIRYNADGSVNKTFGSKGTGVVTTDFLGFPDFANAIALLPGGKFLLAGAAGTSVPVPFSEGAASANETALARYNADGTLDTTFGAGSARGRGG